MDAQWAAEMSGIPLESQVAALKRRHTQFCEMVDAMEKSFSDRRVDVPKASVLSDDKFIYEGVVDDTSELAVDENQVVLSFPFHWKVGMQKVYMVLLASCPTERSIKELSSWTSFSEGDVNFFVRCLHYEGRIEKGETIGTWTCV